MTDNKWSYKPLSALCGINLGSTPSRSKSEYWGKGYSWVSISDLKEKYISKTKEEITDVALAETNCKIVKKGTLLMSFKLSIGKLAFAEKDLYTNEAIAALPIKDESEVLKEYLYYALKSIPLVGGNQAAMGQTLNKQSLSVLQIPLPPTLDDQRRIAKVLSECEGLIQMRNESIELLSEFVRATFLEMFGDLLTVDKGWEQIVLGKHLKIKHGFAFKSEFFSTSGPYVLLTPGNFYEEGGYKNRGEKQKYYVGEVLSDYILKKGDLLIAMTEQTPGLLGSAILVPESEAFLHNQRLGLVEFDSTVFNSRFLFHLFNSKRIRDIIHAKATGMKVRHTSPTKVESILIFKPPLKLQLQFSQISEQAELIKNSFHISLNELKNLYGSINQRAFSGTLDLSKIDISDMEESKENEAEAVNKNLMDEQTEELIRSFEHALPTGEVSSNRETNIRNMSIRQYLKLPEQDENTEDAEFSHMDKDFFYQFIFTKAFPDRTFTLPELQQYADKYILKGTGFEFTYENWKSIIFRFIGAKKPILEQIFDEETKTLKLKLTDEAFKV